MTPLAGMLFLGAALVGHFAATVWLFNRLHALAMPRYLLKTLERLLLLVSALLVAMVVSFWLLTDHWALRVYTVAASMLAALCVPLWLMPKLLERPCQALASNDTTIVDVAARLGSTPVSGSLARRFAALPGNEFLKVAVQQKTLRFAELPRELQGLRIAHLSDLHMTGQLTQAFYEVVVAETNALQPDLVFVTGDILEKEKCLPWIEPTLGRLCALYGRFFILGNHEYRLPDANRLRASLTSVGLVDLGSRCQFMDVRGCRLLLAGNERPWFGVCPDVPPRGQDGAALRILLSHSPDQLPWAKANRFDLMLAGHNHGGQIRLPYLGALIAPSMYGSRYAGGLYFETPTLLHVSRGVAGIHPIRLNCPPEIALLVLEGDRSSRG